VTVAPPPLGDSELLIREARQRQLRRRLLGAAGVAVATALGLSIYASVSGGSPANLGTGPANAGRATGPRCRASQLSTPVGFQGATQMLVGGADVKNVSGAACSLPRAWPRVRIWSGSKRLPVVQRRSSWREPIGRALVLTPGTQAVVEMRWGNWCGTHSLPHEHFVISLGSGLTVTAPSVGAPRCIDRHYASVLTVGPARRPS